MIRLAQASRGQFRAAIVLSISLGWLLTAVYVVAEEPSSPSPVRPGIRRIKVPAEQLDLWLKGDWQPIPLAVLERQFDAANAVRMRPGPYIENAEYSARFADGALYDGRFEWSIGRPEPAARLLPLGDLNLNLDGLAWSGPDRQTLLEAVLCGITPQGTSALLVEKQETRLEGQWSLEGRKLAASTEFDFLLAPATTSQLRIKVPTGMVVSNSVGESPRRLQTAEAGWTEWQVVLGSRDRTRLRIAQAPDTAAARPLNVARTSVSYNVGSEAVRLTAEFDLEVLESSCREVRLLTDPEIQVTSIEYGDDGIVSWSQAASAQGPILVVQLPDPITGPGAALQIKAISQIKQFGPWVLPRIALQNFIEADSKVTLRLQPPFTAADIRSDGYRQLSLTTGAEGESMLYRQMQPGAAITIVPAETKPNLGCRTISLLQADRSQWSLTTQLEWSASAGSAYSVTCRIPPLWEIVDVHSAEQANEAELTGRELEETGSGQRMLHVYFRNALNSSRAQKFRVTARRSPPATEERTVVPVLVPIDARDVEQFTIVAAGPESRPVVESGATLEQIGVRTLTADVRNVDFLAARLSDRSARLLVLRTVGAGDGNGLRIESVEPNGPAGRAGDALGFDGKSPNQEPRPSPSAMASGSVPMSLHVTAKISASSPGFDEYKAELYAVAWDETHPLRFRLHAPAELMSVSADGRRLATVADQRTYTIAGGRPVVASHSAGTAIEIEYRVAANLRQGPNSRKLLFPQPDGEVLRFDAAVVVPEHLRLAAEPESLPFDGLPARTAWWRRLLGPFARAEGELRFNPLDRASWNRLVVGDRHVAGSSPSDRIYRSVAASLPDDVRIVLWQESEVAWLTIAAWALSALAGVLARMGQFRWNRTAGACTLAGLCAAALVLPPVNAEFAAGGLVGLVLASLLPQSFLHWFGGCGHQGEAVPAGSTQSFLPVGLVFLIIGVCWFSPALHAQEPRLPGAAKVPANAAPPRLMFDVLIPVDESGEAAGKNPVAYIKRDLADYLKQAAMIDTLPAYLIGASTYHGRLDETNQLSIRAIFEVQVFADDPVVRVALPLGYVNLGGKDACLVDGQPHPLLAAGDKRNVVLDLSGPPPAADPPRLPQIDESPIDGPRKNVLPENGPVVIGTVGSSSESPLTLPATSGRHWRTHRVELQLQPPAEVGRDNLSTATVTIPASFLTWATVAALAKPAVLGLTNGDANRRTQPAVFPIPSRQVLRPNPTRQLIFYWSQVSAADKPPATDAQLDASCLADLSPGYVQLRYHLAYRAQSGQLDSLCWYVPAGHVLQSVQAPQLAAYQFRPLPDGGREMLIEFSRPQAEDFSLTATFVGEIAALSDSIRLPLVDPLRLEDPARARISLRSHQFALRQPSELQVRVSATASDETVKPRSVDQFLKEWNPAGARPQQAFDLDRAFVLNLAIEPKSISPDIRASSVGRIHPDRLDWNFSAEVEQPLIPRFVYRLQIDPRLRIRNVSVQEDGADRLLRSSHLRDALILFLNDRATRTQTVRVEASLSLALAQEIDMPRIRFVGAVPGPEKMVLFRDSDVSVRLANPEDFPLPPHHITDSGGVGEQLVVRLDALPEQANPRIVVERVLPRVSAEVAVVLVRDAAAWQSTTAVAFQVESGSVTEFAVETPADLVAGLEVKSTPPSRTTQLPEAGGRVKWLFHPDEPVKKRLIAILTHRPDLTSGVWKLPQIRSENAETTRSLLMVPGHSIEPIDPALRPETTAPPDWIDEIAPPTIARKSQIYFWAGALTPAEFRSSHPDAEASVETARLDVWLDRDGTVRGWLGMPVSGSWPQQVEFDWPETCRALSLSVGGEFRSTVARDPGASQIQVSLPRDAKEKLIWLSWIDDSKIHPPLSEPLAPRLPWPVRLPVLRCLVNLHGPTCYRFDVPNSQLLPPETSADQYLPRPVAGLIPDGESPFLNSLWVLPQMPAVGSPLNLGASLRVINVRSGQWIVGIAQAAGAWVIFWMSAPLRDWLTRRETPAWLTLAVLWWLWLSPSWLGLALFAWAGVRAVFASGRPLRAPLETASGGPAH